MNEIEKSAMQIIESYKKAVFEKDIEAFMRLYDPGIRIFDTWGAWSYEGASAWRKMAEGWFSSLGKERVRVTVEDLHISGSEKMILATAIVTYAAISVENVELRSLQNRLTLVIKPDGTDWKIAHEHTSVPIASDHLKAILRREKAS